MSINDDGAGSVPARPVKCVLCGTDLEEWAKTIAFVNNLRNGMMKHMEQETAHMKEMMDYMEQFESESNPGDSDDEDDDEDSDMDSDEDGGEDSDEDDDEDSDEDEYQVSDEDDDEGDDEDSHEERRPWHNGCKWNAKLYPQRGLDTSSAPHYTARYGLTPEIVLKIREITPLHFCRTS